MKSSISRRLLWLFTTRKRTPDEVVAANVTNSNWVCRDCDWIRQDK